ncbi:hypothetical protein ACLK12_00545 [Escherichia coli]
MRRQRPAGTGRYRLHGELRLLSGILTKENIPHKVLNAKFHAMEAGIVRLRLARLVR